MPTAPSPAIIIKVIHDTKTTSHTIEIVAIVAGIVAALAGTWLGHYLSSKRENERAHRQTLASLKAIHAELKTVWGAYMKGPGKDIEKRISSPGEKNALGRYPAVSDSFFTVYSNNATILGELGDDRLTESIILAYQRMIGLFGALGLNNEFHKEVLYSGENFSTVRAIETINKQYRLNYLADELEARHQQIKPEMEELFSLIEKYLQKNRSFQKAEKPS